MRLLTIGAMQQQSRIRKLLLDDYPGAVGGFSLRLINSAYTGNCVQVQRDADDALLDVGFVGGVVDVASLETFANGGQLNVRTWYDQSGLGNNAAQITKARQPWIATAGSVYTENGKAGIFYDGIGGASVQYTLNAPRLVTQKNFIVASVVQLNAAGSGTAFQFLCQHTGQADAGRTVFSGRDDQQRLFIFNNPIGQFYYSVIDNHTQKSILSISSENDLYMSVNGQQETLAEGVADFTPLNANFSIGSFGNGTRSMNGIMQEVVVYNEDRYADRIGLQQNINAYYSIY